MLPVSSGVVKGDPRHGDIMVNCPFQACTVPVPVEAAGWRQVNNWSRAKLVENYRNENGVQVGCWTKI